MATENNNEEENSEKRISEKRRGTRERESEREREKERERERESDEASINYRENKSLKEGDSSFAYCTSYIVRDVQFLARDRRNARRETRVSLA